MLATGICGANTLDAERARELQIPADPYEPLATELKAVGDRLMVPVGPPGTEDGGSGNGAAEARESESGGAPPPPPVDVSQVLSEGMVPEDMFYGADLVNDASVESGNPGVITRGELNRILREAMTDLVATLTSPVVDPEGNVHFSILGFGAFTLESGTGDGGLSGVDGVGALEGTGGLGDLGGGGDGALDSGEPLSLTALLKHMALELLALPLTWLIIFVLLLWFGYPVLARRTRAVRRRRRRRRYRRRRQSARARSEQLQGSTT